MTAVSIDRIVARYAEQLANGPARIDEKILRKCIADMARDVAGTVFLAAQHLVENADLTVLSVDERTDWARRLDAHAREVAAHFALKVSQAVCPNDSAQERSDIEDFALSSFLTALELLVRSTSWQSGCA